MIVEFGKAVLLGLAVAAPVGPIGVLCIRRTLADGRRMGFMTGLGAATADALYALLGALGITAITSTLTVYRAPIRVLGALFLAYLAVQTLRSEPATRAAEARSGSPWVAWLSTLALTLSNPITIASFAAMFAALGFASGVTVGETALVLVAGVFFGSASWWWILSGGVSLLRERITRTHLIWTNRISGSLLLALAIYALASVFRPT